MLNIIHLKETSSTNLYLQDLLKKEKLPEGSVVVAEYQTAGKGQAGNSWESAQRKNLLCSMVLYPDFVDIENQFIVSEVASLAIVDLLSNFTADVRIKWPNDIYVSEKKIAGMLIENNICGNVIESSIVGMGININQDFFESNAPNPVSLKQLTGEEHDLNLLLKTLVENVSKRYVQLMEKGKAAIHLDYFNYLFRRDGYHFYKLGNENFKAKIKAIKSSGHLVLETDQGKERIFAFKEVEFVL